MGAAMRDPFKDPRPGDVVRVGVGWFRRVTRRDADAVEFYSTFGRRSTGTIVGPFTESLEKWQAELHHLEVGHVAE